MTLRDSGLSTSRPFRSAPPGGTHNMGTRRLARGRCPLDGVVLIYRINAIVAESDPALRGVVELLVAHLQAKGLQEAPEARLGDRTRFEVDHRKLIEELGGLWWRLNVGDFELDSSWIFSSLSSSSCRRRSLIWRNMIPSGSSSISRLRTWRA